MLAPYEVHAAAIIRGVGDRAHEWIETGERALHIRRRLTEREAARIGPVVDVRGTKQAETRYKAIAHMLPPHVQHMAQDELAS